MCTCKPRAIRPEVVLIWHRRDLRLHDNALYNSLCSKSCDKGDGLKSPTARTISIYVFDPFDFQPKPSLVVPEYWDTIRVGPHATRVLLEAVASMREELRKVGGELVVRSGVEPFIAISTFVEEIMEKFKHSSIDNTYPLVEVRWSEFPGYEEMKVTQSVRSSLHSLNARYPGFIKIKTECICTLYHPDDLPFGSTAWMAKAYPKQKKYNKLKKTESFTKSTKLFNRSDECIDVSKERFEGMVKIMGEWRRSVRTYARVRNTEIRPQLLVLPDISVDEGSLPTLQYLLGPLQAFVDNSQTSEPNVRRSLLGLDGDTLVGILRQTNAHAESSALKMNHTSEVEATKRLKYFTSSTIASAAARNAVDTEGDVSSHLSTHLAFGTLSPRLVYEVCKDIDGCKWLVSHMEMRDYFMFRAWAEGVNMFQRDKQPVISGKNSMSNKSSKQAISWKTPLNSSTVNEQWRAWTIGRTGLPLVDAAMTELRLVGNCSNRVRQNCASMLTKDLNIDWRAGAELFQFLLDDHEVGANWGNWRYFAGVGYDPKERHFRTISQAIRYDPSCSYVRKWIPSLQNVKNNEAVLRPWAYPDEIKSSNHNNKLWNYPIVDPDSQLTWNDLEKLRRHGLLIDQMEKKIT